jgi:acetyl-CoA synthetase/medium-chain acyl-CoA synthetase
MPKMTLHTHASYGVGHRLTGRLWLDLDENDLHWNISDTGWAKAAWSSLFGPWSCGATIFVHASAGKFQPQDVLTTLAAYPITTLCAAPTIYRCLVQLDLGAFRAKSLRHCVAAGEPLNPEVISTWRKATGLTIRDGYGQTETVLLCGNFPGIDVRAGSMGLPTPGFDLAAIDAEGNRLPPGVEGDIAVRVDPERPIGMFQEYWRNPEAMQQSFRGGWYRTGDCGRVDADGYFWFVGRADDVITSSAYRIGPFEVESALLEHASVAEAAVVGKPDSLRGEIVKAFVVLASGWQPGDELVRTLQEHVKRTTAPYKYPREIEFLDELPKTVSGKIRRNVLRERA